MKVSVASSGVFLSLLTAGLIMSFGLAAAPPANDEMEEVIVRAPMNIARYQVKTDSFSAAAKTEIVELRRAVSVADLDLSSENDLKVLEQRIESVAKDSCKRLSDMFPFDRSDQQELIRCTNEAIESAMEDKERLMAGNQ